MTSLGDSRSFTTDSPLARAVKEFCLARFAGPSTAEYPSNPTWKALRELGTELWLDTGDIEEAKALWCAEFSALTTNNTLLNKEVQKGIYDDLVPEAAALLRKQDVELSDDDVVLETSFILNAVHGLRLVEQFGANVSVELHTDLAHDVQASVAYGLRYFDICPSHFIIKVPLTAAGLIAARRLSDRDVRVNFTLGFSARQNVLISRVAQPRYCNVFMGRINAFLSDRGLGNGIGAGEKATLASQNQLLRLRDQGKTATRQIGASMRGPEQVPGLAGLDVYTMPTKVAAGHAAAPVPVKNQLAAKITVEFDPAVDVDGNRLDVFWDVTPEEERAIDTLAAEPIPELDPERLTEIMAENGARDFLPVLTDDEIKRVQDDGKIPDFEPWRTDVSNGRLAWDTLLTLSGLASFAKDQAALDDRIRQHL